MGRCLPAPKSSRKTGNCLHRRRMLL